MRARSYPREFAERTFRQLEGFGSYGFPESHAASFAKISYASSWMKHHHPDVFCAALMCASIGMGGAEDPSGCGLLALGLALQHTRSLSHF